MFTTARESYLEIPDKSHSVNIEVRIFVSWRGSGYKNRTSVESPCFCILLKKTPFKINSEAEAETLQSKRGNGTFGSFILHRSKLFGIRSKKRKTFKAVTGEAHSMTRGFARAGMSRGRQPQQKHLEGSFMPENTAYPRNSNRYKRYKHWTDPIQTEPIPTRTDALIRVQDPRSV